MEYLIHKLAEVNSIQIGKNTAIWQFTAVLKGASIGENCNINSHCFIENEVIIGNNVTVKCGVYLWDGITIQDDVFIGPNVTFTNDKYPRSKKPYKLINTIIHKGATIGAGSVILCGNDIGEYSMIGAGSLVTKFVPPFTLWYGNPAQHRGYVSYNGEIIGLNLISKSGKKYTYINNQLKAK